MEWIILAIYVVGWFIALRPTAWAILRFDKTEWASLYAHYERPRGENMFGAVFLSLLWPLYTPIVLFARMVKLIVLGKNPPPASPKRFGY